MIRIGLLLIMTSLAAASPISLRGPSEGRLGVGAFVAYGDGFTAIEDGIIGRSSVTVSDILGWMDWAASTFTLLDASDIGFHIHEMWGASDLPGHGVLYSPYTGYAGNTLIFTFDVYGAAPWTFSIDTAEAQSYVFPTGNSVSVSNPGVNNPEPSTWVLLLTGGLLVALKVKS